MDIFKISLALLGAIGIAAVLTLSVRCCERGIVALWKSYGKKLFYLFIDLMGWCADRLVYSLLFLYIVIMAFMCLSIKFNLR